MKPVRWLAAFALLYLISSALAGYYLCETALHPAKRKLSEQSLQKAKSSATTLHAVMNEVSIRGEDGATLKGWYFDAPAESDPTVILFHGLSDNRSGMSGYVQLFLSHGYNVLTPDWRAHGESGGEVATYGILERNDATLWIDWVDSSTRSKRYYALGQSYGAAILLQSLTYEKRICAAVAESSFATFREAAYDRLGQQIGAGDVAGRTILFPAVQAAFLTAFWKYSFDFDEVRPLESLGETGIAVLLIHGQLDKNIPVRHSRLLYAQNKKNGNVEYWESAQAGHSSTFGKWPEEFESRVISWFQKHRC